MNSLKFLLLTATLTETCFAGQIIKTPSMTASWATALMQVSAKGANGSDLTVRNIVHLSLGSTSDISVQVSNEYGIEPLIIDATSIARRYREDTLSTTPTPVTFGGKSSVTIKPGESVWSDPIRLVVPSGCDLAVSFYLPKQSMTFFSQHDAAHATNYLAKGDETMRRSLNSPVRFTSFRYLKVVAVSTPSRGAIVCFGDSITDGSRTTSDTNHRWPDILAKRIAADPTKSDLSVVNVGIGGNRILHSGIGPSALARFDRDVLELPNVKYLILFEGINDIGHSYALTNSYDVITSQELIAAEHLLILRAHAHGIKVYGATLTPYMHASYSSPKGEGVRTDVNRWIRTSKEFDGFIDFDMALRDFSKPDQFLPEYDSGDHLHPNDAGMDALGHSIELQLFSK